MATLKEIAAACGVSVASVSKALNYAPDIGAATAERIRKTAKEMGYHPNAAARALKTNRSHSIGVLFEDSNHAGLTHEYFVHVLNAIKNAAEEKGYDIVFISDKIGRSEMSYLEHCRYRNVDGVVIANVDFHEPSVVELAASDIPVVTIDYSFPGRSSVTSDNRKGLYDLAKYAQSLGHRKIAYIHGEDTEVTQQRIDGLRNAYRDLGMEIPEGYLIPARYHDPRLTQQATRRVLAMEDRPTCIFYPGDVTLISGINEIERSGLRVPDDVSVAGYDGIPLTKLMCPRFTTLHQDSESLGAEATRLLIRQIEDPQNWKPEQLVIPGWVMEGGTIAPIEDE